MYETTYNQVIRHLRAKTPLVNFVTDCERISDVQIPGQSSRLGLSELVNFTAEETDSCVVCFMHDAQHGLRMQVSSSTSDRALPGSSLKTATRNAVDRFVKDNRESSVLELVSDEDLSKGGSPLTLLHREIAASEGKRKVRLLLVAYDALAESARARRILLTHAKHPDTATVLLVTQEPLDDPTLRSYMPVVVAGRPVRSELSIVLRCALLDLAASSGVSVGVRGADGASVEKIADICAERLSGLHIPTAIQVLRLHLESPECACQSPDGGLVFRIDPESLSREKAEILNNAGYVTLVDEHVGVDDVGGLLELKRWLASRRAGFDPEAMAKGVVPPRGMVLVGPPGTAKSMCAKLTAGMFGMPLLRLDVGALFNSKLGSSERNLRSALQVVDASAPCVLLLDEAEKSLGGMNGEADGGTSSRIRGSLLTWLTEKKSSVFVVATANNIDGLPPEMTRRGRWT